MKARGQRNVKETNREPKEQGKNLDEIQKIGIGVPGTVRCSTGEVMYSCNLPLERVNIADIISDKCRLPVTVLNDADAAAYGEYFVDGNKFESFVCITLGTGIGGVYTTALTAREQRLDTQRL